MARPAGYSSDEDEFDGFESSFVGVNENVVNEQDLKEIYNRDKLYGDLIRGNVEDIEQAIKEGLNINEVIHDNWTPLMLAASVGNAEIVKLLLDNGADVNNDRDKYTVLMAACSVPESSTNPAKAFEIVKCLLEKGANPKAITRKRMTALMYAASNGNLDIVKLLLPISDKFAMDNQNWNALFWAVNDSRVEIVKFLLNEGFSDTQVDIRGNSALHYAITNDFLEIAEVLPSNRKKLEMEVFGTNSFRVETLFQNSLSSSERPQFVEDIVRILSGTNSEYLAPIFVKEGMDLKQFLSLTETELYHLGIKLSFEQYRILAALYKLHKRPFLPKSVPVVSKDHIYSNIDASRSILSAIRQITVMEASLAYILNHVPVETFSHFSEENQKTLAATIKDIRKKVFTLKRISHSLQMRTQMWDQFNRPADLITKASIKPRTSWFKVFIFNMWCFTLNCIHYC